MKDGEDQASDKQLVVRVQKGDKRAFDLLVIKYQFKVQAIVSRFVWDRDELADVTQEAFIKAYRAIPNFRGESQFYTWLYRIAVNSAKNYVVARGRRPPESDIDAADAEQWVGSDQMRDLETPESQLFCQELEHAVRQVIADLPEDLRTAVTLREYHDLSYDEIADIMKCPTGTVRSRLFRAREVIDAEVLRVMSGK
ncbi:MAG TPA: RNA polymerase sigma factor RpoE [Porticoccaceae bacterium]|jgi:RNA polymerase sigma-70 factor (ECF subfamily)|nr:RNA polymerase sigma factor RpoE [Porticoccaceae bacterium]